MSISEIQLTREHLVTSRAALTRYLDRREDSDEFMVSGMEALIESLQRRLEQYDCETITR